MEAEHLASNLRYAISDLIRWHVEDIRGNKVYYDSPSKQEEALEASIQDIIDHGTNSRSTESQVGS